MKRHNLSPEFNDYLESIKEFIMSDPIILPPDYNEDFESISDFIQCVQHGGEVEFDWNGKSHLAKYLVCIHLLCKRYK